MLTLLNTPKSDHSEMQVDKLKMPTTYGLTPTMMTAQLNPFNILQTDQFPDILQHFPPEQCKSVLSLLKDTNNSSIVNKKGPLGGYTALHWMCIKNEYELIELLVRECNADINARANIGETPLFICIKNCNFLTIELLIENGADLSARDMYNRSIIHWSAYTGKVVLFHYLQKYHSVNNLNDVDQFQQNALHIACASGFVDLIRYLIDSGDIDLFAQDLNGNTCLHMAAKCGLPRVCWQITEKNKGDCVRLIGMENKQNQTPYEMIRNERAPHFKKLRSWLRREMRSNPKLTNASDKKSDMARRRFRIFKWSSKNMLRLEWFFRFAAFFLIVTIPYLFVRCVFGLDSLSIWNGVIMYGSCSLLLLVLTKQKHRISHISGVENPFFLGYFFAFLIHNYKMYYVDFLDPLSITNFYHVVSVFLSCIQLYATYKILSQDPGFARESIRRPDGTPYELHDLMKFKNRDRAFSSKNSLNWLLRPSTVDRDGLNQAYFCETCLIVQAAPAKHCKLCEHCCTKFDHHCIYVNKCIGLKNHKYFIYFVIMTLLNTTVFLVNIYMNLHDFYLKLEHKHLEQPIEDRISFLYYLVASPYQIWLVILSLMNGLPMIMVVILLILQLRVISLGFTSQYPPAYDFTYVSKNTRTWSQAIKHRIDNLSIFFLKSYEDNAELFYRQQKEYAEIKADKPAIPTDYYPKNGPTTDMLFNSPDFFNFANQMGGVGGMGGGKMEEKSMFLLDDDDNNNKGHSTSLALPAIKSSNSSSVSGGGSKDKQFEIELD